MGCGVRRRRQELRWPLLACQAESDRVVSTSQSESGANYTSLSDDSGMG